MDLTVEALGLVILAGVQGLSILDQSGIIE